VTVVQSLALPIGIDAAWKRDDLRELVHGVRVPAAIAVAVTVVVGWFVYGRGSWLTGVGVLVAAWVMASSLIEPIAHWRRKRRIGAVPRGVLGMCVAHFGLGVFILGVTVTKTFSAEQDIPLKPGESARAGAYEFVFQGVAPRAGPNYAATRATVEVHRGGELVTILHPEKRTYLVQRNPMTESDIDARLSRDLYVALGEDVGANAWSVRVQYKPLVRLIWLGALIMAFGGFLAISDPRYRRARAAVEERVPTVAQEA
jgi:cytochrome c-type biogenesis protein CcmF